MLWGFTPPFAPCFAHPLRCSVALPPAVKGKVMTEMYYLRLDRRFSRFLDWLARPFEPLNPLRALRHGARA